MVKMSYIADTLGWSDLLSKHNLKPWWETVRSTTLVVMMIISTFLFVTNSVVAVSCLPVNANVSYSAAEAKFVEKVCNLHHLFLPHNMFWMSALATGVTFVVNNVWFYVPAVGNAIRRFSVANELHNELQAILPSLVSIITTPNSAGLSNESMEQRHKLRELLTLLGTFMRSCDANFNPNQDDSVTKKEKKPSTANPTPTVILELAEDASSNTRDENETLPKTPLLDNSTTTNVSRPPSRSGEGPSGSSVHSARNQLQTTQFGSSTTAVHIDKQTSDSATDKRYVAKVFAKFYKIRNIFSLLLAIIFCGGSCCVIWFLDSEFSFMLQWNFTCTQSIQLKSNYSCIYSGLVIVYGSSILLLACYVIQIGIFAVLLIKYWNADDLKLLNSFAKRSDTDTSRTFIDCIDNLKKEPHILAEEAKRHFGDAIDKFDIDFFYFAKKTLRVDLKRAFTDVHRAKENYKSIFSDFKFFGEILPEPIKSRS